MAGLVSCIALMGVNFAGLVDSIGMAFTVVAVVLLSLCALVLCVFLIGQVAKLKRKIIFIADENGICDYSRHIVLKPIAYGEIESIEYKEFLSSDIEASELRHLTIKLKDRRSYMKKLNPLQKIGFLLTLGHIELHLFCGKTKIKDIAAKLKQNLETYNRENSGN